MSALYKIFYSLGFTPWEEGAGQGPAAAQISTLFEREEQGQEPPYGKVLDLGCGSGVWSIKLAERGWHVTGVDIVPKAIRRARERAQAAGVPARFLEGDVTALRKSGVESGFRFVVDFECFNHLSRDQRKAVGREVTEVASDDATMLILAWMPGRRGPLPSGADRAEIQAAFPEWEVVDEEPYTADSGLPWWLKKVEIRFYRLRRRTR
jgi:SAM-dependent methyltransferase